MPNHYEANPLRDRLLLPEAWSDALAALQGHERCGISWEYVGKHNPQWLADLLAGDDPIPQYVRETLSRLLLPPKGYIGGRLSYSAPKKRAIHFRASLSKSEQAKLYIADRMNAGEKFDTAVKEAAAKFGMSVGWARNLKPADSTKALSKLKQKLDHGTLQP